jgi:hypothetical protein
MSEIIELISDSSIDTTTSIGTVNLTQKDPLLCGFINVSYNDSPYRLLSSACMFMKQFSPFNLRLFETNIVEKDTMTFVRVNVKDPAYFICRINLHGTTGACECTEEETASCERNFENIIENIKQELKSHDININIIHDQQNILIVG